jgi:hypothetical protein
MYTQSIKLLFFSFISLSSVLHAQEIQRSSINSGGHVARSEGIMLSQSIGQAAPVGRASADHITVRQGFQQPVSLERDTEQRIITIVLYPNPNDGNFSFTTDLNRDETFSYQIMDSQGKLILADQAVGGQETPVSIDQKVQTGTYILAIISQNNWKGQTKIVVTK